MSLEGLCGARDALLARTSEIEVLGPQAFEGTPRLSRDRPFQSALESAGGNHQAWMSCSPALVKDGAPRVRLRGGVLPVGNTRRR
jgi:hypothetical protein